jgi:hypothetical protein
MAGRNIIWLSKDADGSDLVNMDIYGPNNEVLFSMRDNDWAITADLKELDCPPSAKSLLLKDAPYGIRLGLNFREVSDDYLKAKVNELMDEGLKRVLASQRKAAKSGAPPGWHERNEAAIRQGIEIARDQTYQAIRSAVSGDPVTLCIVTARLVWPFTAILHERYSEWPNANLFIGSFSRGGAVAVDIT